MRIILAIARAISIDVKDVARGIELPRSALSVSGGSNETRPWGGSGIDLVLDGFDWLGDLGRMGRGRDPACGVEAVGLLA
jgi:hypothetical protein